MQLYMSTNVAVQLDLDRRVSAYKPGPPSPSVIPSALSVGPRNVIDPLVRDHVRSDVDMNERKASLESTSTEKARKACKA
jgi:hypothetical protein